MHTAADKFAEQVATAFMDAKPRADTGLSRTDQREAISITAEWCLTHRSEYDPERGDVGAWFGEHLRRVLRDMRRSNQREAVRRARFNMDEAERNRTVTPSRRSELHYSVRWHRIDHEVERLLQRPKHERADCPSCWRCRWYDGLTPAAWAPPTLASPEVRAAVDAVERRKIEIAGAHPEDYAK